MNFIQKHGWMILMDGIILQPFCRQYSLSFPSLSVPAMRLRFLAGLVVCIAWIAFAAPAQGADAIEQGIAAHQTGDYKTAIEKWHELIKEGRPEGSFFLGIMYAEGKGVEQNHAKAFALYTTAAEMDFAPAQYNLGNQYATGEGVAMDLNRAESWWTKAAERGLVQAQTNLGNFYYHGVIRERNPALARKWLTLAAEQGSPHAKETLAKLDAEEAQAAAAAPAAEAPEVNAADATRIARATAAPDAAAEAAETLRREAWVLAQPGNHYTIQILAAGTDDLAREFIKQQGLAAEAAYIESPGQSTAVFRVIHGSYTSRALADKALAALPRGVAANSPWIRSFAEVHKLVDRRHAKRGAP